MAVLLRGVSDHVCCSVLVLFLRVRAAVRVSVGAYVCTHTLILVHDYMLKRGLSLPLLPPARLPSCLPLSRSLSLTLALSRARTQTGAQGAAQHADAAGPDEHALRWSSTPHTKLN